MNWEGLVEFVWNDSINSSRFIITISQDCALRSLVFKKQQSKIKLSKLNELNLFTLEKLELDKGLFVNYIA